uniref:Uncharacterized protein n=1 Tax=Corethron hystrix TaxID=216773 RepID=A0A7S1BVK2_9STRA|mmetsp:Transcript_40809/g.95741  ORF Transcript_40809/g.95741 Transcript_40809/m.95741 type:complete len:265 (+) Transcript_40809:72-866(+)
MSSQSSSPPPPPHILPLNYDDSECDPITPDSRSAQELYRRIHHGMNPSSSVSTEDEALSWIEHVTLNQSAWQCLSNTSIGLCPTMDMMMRRYFHSWHRRKRQLSAVMMDKVDDLEESDEEGDAFTTWLPVTLQSLYPQLTPANLQTLTSHCLARIHLLHPNDNLSLIASLESIRHVITSRLRVGQAKPPTLLVLDSVAAWDRRDCYMDSVGTGLSGKMDVLRQVEWMMTLPVLIILVRNCKNGMVERGGWKRIVGSRVRMEELG